MAHAVGYGEDVAGIMGSSLQDYANFGMWNYGDGATLASSNAHNGTVDSSGRTIESSGKAYDNFVERNAAGELDYRQVISIRGGGPAQATGMSVDENNLTFKGQDLPGYTKVYVNYINGQLMAAEKELVKKGYSPQEVAKILGQYKEKMVQSISAEEFDSSLVSLPREIKKLDPTTKVKIFDSGQSDEILKSIMRDYDPGEQIVLQGHSAGGGDVQDVAEKLKEKGVGNVVTVQIDSVEPFGDDASIPGNVTKAVNVYQKESKTGNAVVDFIDPNAMNGEDKIQRAESTNTTVIVNKKIEHVTGPSQGLVNSPHRNMDNDHRVQTFVQEQVLPEVEKDIKKNEK